MSARQEEIDYASCCLLLPESEAERTGEILDERLSGKSLEERAALCLTARKVWERYFRPEHFRQYALALLERNKPSQGAPAKPWRYVLGRHDPRRARPGGGLSATHDRAPAARARAAGGAG